MNFIMEHEQMSYVEALKYLAEKYHIPVEEKELTEEQRKEKTERESMLIVSSYANEYSNINCGTRTRGVPWDWVTCANEVSVTR